MTCNEKSAMNLQIGIANIRKCETTWQCIGSFSLITYLMAYSFKNVFCGVYEVVVTRVTSEKTLLPGNILSSLPTAE